MYHDNGRVHAALVGVAHFGAYQACAGRGLAFHRAWQHARDFGRGHIDKCGVIGSLNAVKQAVYAAFFQRGNIVKLCKIKEIQLAGDVALDVVAPLFADAVPFV